MSNRNSNGWVELYRAFVPRAKILNDNTGQHYRTMQGKLSYLKTQFDAFVNGDEGYNSIIGGFTYEDAKDARSLIENAKAINIRCEVWRANNIAFDPHNYAKTFKMPIDRLTTLGLMAEDDNWKYIFCSSYAGGGRDAWSRSYNSRVVDINDEPTEVIDGIEIMSDGLPKEMSPDWWKLHTEDYGDIFIRVLIQEETL